MHALRRPVLVNKYEKFVDSALSRLCARYGARLHTKIGLKDVLPLDGSGLSRDDYHYGLMAHFDFVITDQDGEAQLAVEFDEPHHQTDPVQMVRDERKNRICNHFYLPLVRARVPSLKQADHRTLLEWLLEVWFEYRALKDQKYAYGDGDDEPPEIDPDDFKYQTAYAMPGSGLRSLAPLDAFRAPRERVARWVWADPVSCRTCEGWYGQDPQGYWVGRIALQVEEGAWLTSSARVSLTGLYELGALPKTIFGWEVAQDIAMLDVARQLDAWEREQLVPGSTEGLAKLTTGLEEGLLTHFPVPNKTEQRRIALDWLRERGVVDLDDPAVFLRVNRLLDAEESDDFYDDFYEDFRDDFLS